MLSSLTRFVRRSTGRPRRNMYRVCSRLSRTATPPKRSHAPASPPDHGRSLPVTAPTVRVRRMGRSSVSARQRLTWTVDARAACPHACAADLQRASAAAAEQGRDDGSQGAHALPPPPPRNPCARKALRKNPSVHSLSPVFTFYLFWFLFIFDDRANAHTPCLLIFPLPLCCVATPF